MIAPDGITFGDAPPIVTLAEGRVREGDHEGAFVVPRLRDALAAGTPSRATLVLAVAPSIPFRTVRDVAYTAGQAGRSRLLFVVRAGGQRGVLPVSLVTGEPVLASDEVVAELDGRAPDPGAPQDTPPDRAPSIWVGASGIVVATPSGRLLPGCRDVGSSATVTVPREDWVGLGTCLAQAPTDPAPHDRSIVGAEDEIPWRDVASAIAAVRGTATAPLYPRVELATGIR